jgi:hypothetical protein
MLFNYGHYSLPIPTADWLRLRKQKPNSIGARSLPIEEAYLDRSLIDLLINPHPLRFHRGKFSITKNMFFNGRLEASDRLGSMGFAQEYGPKRLGEYVVLQSGFVVRLLSNDGDTAMVRLRSGESHCFPTSELKTSDFEIAPFEYDSNTDQFVKDVYYPVVAEPFATLDDGSTVTETLSPELKIGRYVTKKGSEYSWKLLEFKGSRARIVRKGKDRLVPIKELKPIAVEHELGFINDDFKYVSALDEHGSVKSWIDLIAGTPVVNRDEILQVQRKHSAAMVELENHNVRYLKNCRVPIASL